MPSTETPGQRGELHEVARRYHRRERIAGTVVAIAVVGLFLGTYLATELLPAVVVAAALLLILRAPVFHSSGTVRLRTDDDPDAVLEEFTGPRPPILAFQWCVADAVTTTEHRAVYSFSYLFGIRSTEMAVDTQVDPDPDGIPRVELAVSVDDAPWGTYTVTVDGTDAGSVVEVAYASDRRFGLRRVPQQLFGKRYHDAVLDAQGYTVEDRERHVSIRPSTRLTDER